MYIALMGCAQQGSSTPFAVSISGTDALNIAASAGSGTATSSAGDIDILATASGGSGSYTFTWQVTEVDDPNNALSIASAGTTNATRYDTLTITGVIPANAFDPPNSGVYQISCEVSDGVASNITVNRNVIIDVIGL
tara:strand:+ start:745 stop:1155 length:411 start_codon:yes stop_codon:yes gene_type:complete